MAAVRLYSVYVLFLLFVAYLLNQLDRYMVAIVSQPMAQDIHFGDLSCLSNNTLEGDILNEAKKSCRINNATATKQNCLLVHDSNGTQLCEWTYTGQGQQFQLLAGPLFILIYTFMGIPLGIAADLYNRKVFLSIAVVVWSLATLLMAFVQNYWQLALLRFLQGFGEAGCTPFASSLIANYFDETIRATAFGFYNWGIYTGYSLAFAVGNLVTVAKGWRWSFIVSGVPGLVLGPLILLSVREPDRLSSSASDQQASAALKSRSCSSLKTVLKIFLQPTLIMLILAGSIRNAAGYVWAYNTQNYFKQIGQTEQQIAHYMSWIPILGGCVGVVLGGWLSDVVVKRVGPYARLGVLVISQVIAAPFIAGALYLKTSPYFYLTLIPGYIFGEMWVSVTLAVALKLVPSPVHTTAVAVYLFIITNIGGNMPLLVPPLQRLFKRHAYNEIESLRGALYILYPGLYILGALLFLLTMTCLWFDLRKVKETEEQQPSLLLDNEARDDSAEESDDIMIT